MTYKILAEMSAHVRPGEDRPDPTLCNLAANLKTAIALARQYRAPAPNDPANRVKQMAGDFQKMGDKVRAQELDREIIKLQAKLRKHGAEMDADGNVKWTRTPDVVLYDYSLEKQGLTRVQIISGLLYNMNGVAVDTSAWSTAQQPGAAMYVMSVQGNIHYDQMEVDKRHHSSLLAGMKVAGAGEFKVRNGRITFLSNDSGHYDPTLKHFLQVLHQLSKNGVPMDFAINYVYLDARGAVRDDPYRTLLDFLLAYNIDDDSYDANNLIEGYGHLLTPDRLDSKNWEYRPGASPPGVYVKGSAAQMVPHREVRHHFKHLGTPQSYKDGRLVRAPAPI